MDGSGLFQVLVTLAVILLAIFALGRARRRPAGKARDDDRQAAEDGASADAHSEVKDGLAGEPDADDARFRDGYQNVFYPEDEETIRQTTPLSARPSPWKREDSRAIRKTAWRLYRGRFWRVMPLFAMMVLLGYAGGMAADAAGASSRLTLYLILGLLGWLLSPVLSAGSAFAALEIWRGESPRFGMLAAFLTPRRFFRSMHLTLILALAQALPALFLFGGLTALIRGMDNGLFLPGAWVLPVIVLALGLGGMIWIGLRTSLSFYALANDPDKRATEAFETGFRATRGRLRPLFGMAFVTGWPLPVAAGLTAWVIAALPALPQALTDWAYAALLSLYVGYLCLTEAGLADRLLLDDAKQASPEPPIIGEASGQSPGEPLSPEHPGESGGNKGA